MPKIISIYIFILRIYEGIQQIYEQNKKKILKQLIFYVMTEHIQQTLTVDQVNVPATSSVQWQFLTHIKFYI